MFNNIVSYEIGACGYHDTDLILVKASPNGKTNITDKVIEAIAERYTPHEDV